MAYGLNKVQLIGNLGGDPDLKYTESNVAVATFSIATNESYKDQNGNLIERTEWHRCVAWRKPAEIIHQYLKKGSKVYVEGKLQTRSWDDKDGSKRYTTEVVVNDWVFLDAKGGGGGGSDRPPLPEPGPEPAQGKKDEDLPF